MDDELRSQLPITKPEELARDLVAARSHDPRLAVGAQLIRRLDTSGAPGLGAAAFSRRFVQRALRLGELELTVSPYAPPQRQLSAASQGAPMWPTAGAPPAQGPAAPHAASPAPPPTPRAAALDIAELPPDLKALLAMHRSRGTI